MKDIINLLNCIFIPGFGSYRCRNSIPKTTKESFFHLPINHNIKHLDYRLHLMEAMHKIAFFCGCLLLVVLLCPTVTAVDDQAGQYYDEGIDFADLGWYTEAVASYDKAIAIDPNFAEAWYNRGIALHYLKRYSDAVASYDKAIAVDKNYADAWVNRGVALRELGRYSEAVASYDKAISLDPNYAKAWNNRGNALGELGQYSEAIASFDKAIAIDPNYAKAKQNREFYLSKQNGRQNQTTPLLYAPIGAIVLMAGIAVWGRHRYSL
jgi:tetratricopeptide (TPR) repeat protein